MSEGYKGHTEIPAISEFRRSSLELAKSRDESQNLLTLQFPACAPHVAFTGCTTHEPSREINFLSNLHRLNTKLITNKSHNTFCHKIKPT